MLLQDKKRASYYAALAIFFGSVELFIPKILPFFRLGVSNIPVLLALDMKVLPFILLLALKGIGNSYVQGNLFSIFSIISILQALLSGLGMWVMKKLIKENISLYAISSFGALISTFTQLLLSALYVGWGVMGFAPLMLILSLISSILVAFVAKRINLPKYPPEVHFSEDEKKGVSALTIILLLISSFSLMMNKSIILSLFAFGFALIFEKICGRRIMVLPYLMVIIFSVISSLFTPNGEVLIKVLAFDVTKGALRSGLLKGLNLSGAIALSQGYSALIKPSLSVLGETLSYFTALLVTFRNTDGKLSDRIRETLSLKDLEYTEYQKKKVKVWIAVIFAVVFCILTLISYINR